MNSKELKFIESKVYEIKNLKQINSSLLKNIYLNQYDESDYFIQTYGTVEKLVIKDSSIKLDSSKVFAPKLHSKEIKIKNSKYYDR